MFNEYQKEFPGNEDNPLAKIGWKFTNKTPKMRKTLDKLYLRKYNKDS